MTKVVVGMSGGVDSSVAAYLLKQEGYSVTGVFMQNWQDDSDEYCTIKEDSLDVIAVADLLGIEVDIINFSDRYQRDVFSYFLAEYRLGRTPNPDVLCNSEIKFKAFLEHALNLDAAYIATGHYVAKNITDQGAGLCRAFDSNKDHSYFLYRLNQYQLSHSLFPLANLLKPEVRKIAAQLKLPNAAKKDSTGICFIGKRPFREFLQKYLPITPGPIVNLQGTVLGDHQGLMYYTIGQRQGLGIGGNGQPWFVAAKDLASNQLLVVQGHDHPLLTSRCLRATNLSFVLGQAPMPGRFTAKTRYRMQDAPCSLDYLDADRQVIQLTFDEPQWAVTPGQSVVIYKHNFCLGGGIISE